MPYVRTLTLLAALTALAGSAAADPAAIARALDDPDRLEGDRAADVRRRPDAVLKFFGIGPGLTVLDLYSGGGYYAEIVARVVGEEGRVVAHNNTPYLKFAEDELARRFADGRLSGVERLTAENNELELTEGRFDAALLILGYHDIYYEDASIGWAPVDGPAFLAEIRSALKPGGVLGVVDHAAAPGAPASAGGTLHRIDPGRLRAEIEAAGFVFDGESKALRNLSDDHTLPAFDPDIRGRTDRVVYRFTRPE